MTIAGNILFGIAALFALIGVLTIWVPFFGFLMLLVSAACWFVARMLRRLGRKQAVLRQQGGQGLF